MGRRIAGMCFLLFVLVALTSCTVEKEATSETVTNDQETAKPSVPAAETLRSVADRRGFGIGAAVNVNVLAKDAEYRKTIAEQFNTITPENDMKFSRLHAEKDKYAFEKADALMAFAAEHKIAVRGHTLVWHRALPNWVVVMDVLRRSP